MWTLFSKYWIIQNILLFIDFIYIKFESWPLCSVRHGRRQDDLDGYVNHSMAQNLAWLSNIIPHVVSITLQLEIFSTGFFYSFGYCSARCDTYLVQIQCKYCHIMRGLYWYLAIKIFEFLYQITYIVSVFKTIHYVFIKETGSLYFRFPVLKGLKIMTTISGFQRVFFQSRHAAKFAD